MKKDQLYWRNANKELPPVNEEVIVLCDNLNINSNFYISFGHVVNKEICIDYNGWSIPNVKYWMPCPEILTKS